MPEQTAVSGGETKADSKSTDGAVAEPSEKPATPSGEVEADKSQVAWVEFGDFAWQVLAVKGGAQAKGLSNLRRALVTDTTFDWQTSNPREDEPNWAYAIIVNDGRDWATILFDFDSQRVALTGSRRTARLNAEATDDFAQFFREQFPSPPATPAEAAPAENEKPPEPTAEPAVEAKNE